MGEYGILMQDEMVRALLRPVGHPLRKRVTRRTSDQWAKRKVGDLLWVRECFATGGIVCPIGEAVYRATFDPKLAKLIRWKPGIHMPRWASRLTYRIVGLWREPGRSLSRRRPLPEVDVDEAHREGVEGRAEYLALWEAINGPVYPEMLWRIELEEVSRG